MKCMKYGVVGFSGRMGKEIINVFTDAGHELVLKSDALGTERGGRPDVILDFSSSAALPVTIALCEGYAAPLIAGTTALGDADLTALKTLSEKVAVVQSFNFATGVTLLRMIMRDYAPLLESWDLEIEETHHNKKKDAPSGTAILLRDATGRKNAPTHSMRIGGVPGDHSLRFGNEGEILTFAHRALSRGVFAIGALSAAAFAVEAKPGFYTFEDVLNKGRKV
ncbi:4-hydroxy-tetrahydrodipicolinate reductase [Synergistales bacterium]|nr:4-hydroxy-tetrahydrodipicolinate reductase [Synergistales bacterium]